MRQISAVEDKPVPVTCFTGFLGQSDDEADLGYELIRQELCVSAREILARALM